MAPGLFDGFEGYRSPSDHDLVDAVQRSLVVLDTNILLSLYGYQGATLHDFMSVFEALGDRLFVPHQVIDEFWRNRTIALKENQGKYREVSAVEDAFDEIETAFKRWYSRVVDRTASPPKDSLKELQEARVAVLEFMRDRTAETKATTATTPTSEDQVLLRLEPILAERVGPRPSPHELEEWEREGKDRLARKVPPGYMDAGKDPGRAIGDFLVWKQAMLEAAQRKLPLLFVTDDGKEDWWSGTTARPELVRELMDATGRRLLMVRGLELVKLGRALGVRVSDTTLKQPDLSDGESGAWTPELADEYLEWLWGWPEHYQIFAEAARSDGQVSRARMAKILGRQEDDSMRGVGKPYVTALRRLMDYDAIDADLPVPLYASYEVGGWMSSFVMPAGLVSMFVEALTRADEQSPEAEA